MSALWPAPDWKKHHAPSGHWQNDKGGLEPYRIHPVAYTHLDVYKRQTLEDARKPSVEVLVQAANEVTYTSVSYTHLDVYKRQGAVSAKEGERLLIPINMRDGSPVSYTHLCEPAGAFGDACSAS